jgi:hypothetical protein
MIDNLAEALKRAKTKNMDEVDSMVQARRMSNLMDTDRLNEAICRNPQCDPARSGREQYPHRHPVPMCKGHTLCIADKFKFRIP